MQSGAFWWLLQALFVSIIMFSVYTLLYCVHVEMSVDLSRQIILFSLWHLYSASRSRSEPSVSHYTSPFIHHHHHHHSSERIGGDGPLLSPPFTIISHCPGLLSSQVCRFEDIP